MKAEIIGQIVYDGPFFGAERMGRQVRKILIPDANNLVVTVDVDNNHLSVSDGFEKKETDASGRVSCSVLKEIDVSDEFVEKATIFMEAEDCLKQTFKETIKMVGD